MSQTPQNTKITHLEIAILILGNILLLLFLYALLTIATSGSQYTTDRGFTAAITTILIWIGSPILVIPWFILSLINLIKHKTNYRTRAIALFISPSLATFLTAYEIIALNVAILPATNPVTTIILASILIIASDIIFFILCRSPQNKQLPH